MILLARQNPNGFNLAYVWLFLSTCSNIYSTIRYNSLMSDLDQFFPEESMSGTYQVAASIGGTLACNLTVLAVLITCAVNSQPKQLEESGFHLHHHSPPSQLQPPPKG
jgi:MFS-type transporter involved in bile tolerance (Atg22 family)